MTLWVSREPGGDVIRLQVTSGPVTVVVDEHEPAMRYLHSQLGELLAPSAAPPEAPAGAPAGEVT